MRRILLGSAATACALAVGAVAIGQITNGVPSARQRSGSPDIKLAGGWDQKILALGTMSLENPSGIFTQYGYLNDAGTQTSGLKTKTEPDQNTYVVTTSNPGGPTSGYDYGRHFLIQGHELFIGSSDSVGHTNAAYLTRINLDVPLNDPHRITLLTAPTDSSHSGIASADGSTYDPFTGQLLFTGEAGDSFVSGSDDTQNPTAGQIAYGGVYATALNWSSTTQPALVHPALQASLGHAGFEGIQVNDRGSLIIEEDAGGITVSNGVKKANSYVFRFVPTSPSDLTSGTLQALQVSVDGTPLTFANQGSGQLFDPIAGTGSKRLYSGEQLSATWVNVHTSGTAAAVGCPGSGSTTNFDANCEARAAGATPFKRPENGRFVPGSGFKSFVFTVTGDTSATAGNFADGSGNKAADRAAWGAVMRIDMPDSANTTTSATVRAVVPGDGEHASYDSIAFLDKDTILVGEDRGDALHSSFNALDSTWSFDLHKPIDQVLGTSQRLIAQGRDPESTDDVTKKEGSPPVADQNDGDNEVTGVLVSDGVSTTSNVFGTEDPADESGTRIFYTGQHGANVTYELLVPGDTSGTTPPGVIGPPGPAGQNGAPGSNGSNGANGAAGASGAPGATGPQGATGASGPQGTTGPQGNTGARGRDGLTILCRVIGRHVTCTPATASKVKSKTRARLTRRGRTYARGTLRWMHRMRHVSRGRYSLFLGRGHSTRRLTVTVR